MSFTPRLILHVGLPKGGSSALQSALSRTPDLRSADGRLLRYTALALGEKRQRILHGRTLTAAAQRTAHGYVSWPNMRPADLESPVFENLRDVMEAGGRGNFVPVASCEGWINRADLFAEQLRRWGHPAVEVVAFLRPPVDWANAAYWQWGIWNVPNLDVWLTRKLLPYSFGLDLERWSQIPNLRLRLCNARPDVLGKFSALYDVVLPAAPGSNSSSPAALIGFLLRNRRFRPTGHDASTEFVFQRWCPPVAGRRLWALRARHVLELRPTVLQNRTALRRIATEAEMQDILSDERWLDERPYHPDLRAGPSALDDAAEMAGLHAALLLGATRACEAAGLPAPDGAAPPQGAPTAAWDAALSPLMQALLEADLAVRRAPDMGRIGDRVRTLFPRLLGGL